MSECQSCSAKCQLFLCAQCGNKLREMLKGLSIGWEVESEHKTYRTAGAIEWLEDTRLGRTRLGESARQSTEKNSPLVVRLGADGDWANSPVDRLKRFHNTLSTWIRHLCESRGAAFQPIRSVPVWFVGPLLDGWRRLARDYHATTSDCAEWLAAHVDAVACDPAAGELFDEVRDAIDEIERAVNRPIPDRFLGPCPAVLTDNYGERICNTELTARRDIDQVQCSVCKTTHRVSELHERQMDNTGGMSFTLSELYRLILPINKEYVPLRTLQHWVAHNHLAPTGYDADGEPRFLLNDVREQRERRRQTGATGATAHLKNQRAC